MILTPDNLHLLPPLRIPKCRVACYANTPYEVIAIFEYFRHPDRRWLPSSRLRVYSYNRHGWLVIRAGHLNYDGNRSWDDNNIYVYHSPNRYVGCFRADLVVRIEYSNRRNGGCIWQGPNLPETISSSIANHRLRELKLPEIPELQEARRKRLAKERRKRAARKRQRTKREIVVAEETAAMDDHGRLLRRIKLRNNG